MKNKVLLVCAGFLLLIFLMFGTYMWYIFFIQYSGTNSETNNSTNIQSGNIVFKDDGNGVYELNAKSLEDSQIDNVPSYNFQIENTKKYIKLYFIY